MKGDFTRFTFRSENHYRSVQVQQGRVQLDADWNEQADIEAHRDETTARDLIGPQGAPWSGGGFQVGPLVIPRSLRAIDYAGSLGLVVGDDATILRSFSAGTWNRQPVPSAIRGSLRGVCVTRPASAGPAIAFAVGDAATIVSSPDDGQTWSVQIPTGVSATLRAVHSIDGQRAVAVGDNGTVLLTVNGTDWSRQAVPAGIDSTLRAVFLVQSGAAISGFIVGDNATILVSTDGGATWSKQSAPQNVSANLRGVHFPSAQVGFVVGDGPTILSTTNGGANWVAQATPAGVTANLRGVRFSSTTNGTAVGDEGTILSTTNGGTTWPKVTPPGEPVDLRGVAAPSLQGVITTTVVGDDSVILTDLDGWRRYSAPKEWGVSAGHLYVDGILCENERNVSLSNQPDASGITLSQSDPPQLVFLDVWERHLTAVERPELREVALGGPDTTTRTKTVWQVKAAPNASCGDVVAGWAPPERPAGTGRLAARAAPVPPVTDVCLVPATGGYRRLENQLYRIEIHGFRGTDSQGTFHQGSFKWSRDNGSTTAAVERIQDGLIKVSNPGNSPLALGGFAGAKWVEVIDDATVLTGAPGTLVGVSDALDSTLPIADGTVVPPPGPGGLVRRWESGAIPMQIGTWIKLGIADDLEGVEIRFDAGTYQTGDYWVIPARTLTGTIEWPLSDGEARYLPPKGVQHHYAPLAMLRYGDGDFVATECRRLFPWLTDLATLFYVGGDGQECLPGDQLPQPLEVACSVPGRVRFTASHGTIAQAAPVPQPGPTEIVIDDTQAGQQGGVYTCYWRPDATVTNRSQRVVAVLLDDDDNPTGKPVRFSANLSLASQVQYDPGTCVGLAGANTVQTAIDAIAGAARIEYLGGDGQESMPGFPLLQPLQVELVSTCIVAATVRFETQPNGRVAATAAALNNPANQVDIAVANGIASCFWMLDPGAPPAAPTQTVTATRLDGQGNKVGVPVIFNGNLSIASQVGYDPSNCLALAGSNTVQKAIDKMMSLANIRYLSGTGQVSMPGQPIPEPLRVDLSATCSPGATVRFAAQPNGRVAASAAALPNATNQVDIPGAGGVAGCLWMLDSAGASQQTVTATLIDSQGNASGLPVVFTGSFAATKPASGLHVVKVILPASNNELLNDVVLKAADLARGINVFCDGALDPLSVNDKPVVSVTLEVPYPLALDDHMLWGPPGNPFPIGKQLVVLDGTVRLSDDPVISWLPSQIMLTQIPFFLSFNRIQQVLAHFVVKGRFIWSRDGARNLDAQAFAPQKGSHGGLQFPTTDSPPGGDLEMWFRIAP